MIDEVIHYQDASSSPNCICSNSFSKCVEASKLRGII